ncbi:hypothetical protein [Streptomyces venezuelae]|uniref:hypothetical protein n=1 Tax=Streptomyces venezuelae TaxID=54571 RepID=UPI003415BF96
MTRPDGRGREGRRRVAERFPDGLLHADPRGSPRDEHPVPPAVVLLRFLGACVMTPAGSPPSGTRFPRPEGSRGDSHPGRSGALRPHAPDGAH